ncbi:MAG: hypothetical protein Q9188_005133 [Gyalolechia gomerana]
MTRPTTPPILSELRSSTSPASQVAALRALKTDIVGHEQRKRMWVGLGVLVPIARILNISKGVGKRRDPIENGTAHYCRAASTRSDEEEARLQAIIVVGSLAHGGPAYIPSIRTGGVIAPMLSLVSTTQSSASTVLAALRTLNTIADASAPLHLDAKNRSNGIFQNMYNDDFLTSIVQLLSQNSTTQSVQRQISLTAALIAKTCSDETQRHLLVHAGVLEALASRLSMFVAATDGALYASRRALAANPGKFSAPTQLQLAPIFAAIGAILDTSRSRALHFLSTPAMTTVLLRLAADTALPHEKRANSWHHLASTSAGTRASSPRSLDYLLPQVPCFPSKGTQAESSFHPPFGAAGTSARQPYAAKVLHHANDLSHGQAIDSPQEEENPLVIWFIYVVRASSGLTRLMAAWIISLFHCSGLIDRRRDSSFAMLLIPLLVRQLDKESTPTAAAQLAYDTSPLRSVNLTSQEQAPAILATLMIDNIELQRAAVEAGAIKKLAQLLKESYNPLPVNSSSSQWTAEPSLEERSDGIDEELFTNNSTNSTSACQVAKTRESVLLALASLASIKDEYRKAIIENGVVPFVIESLKPFHRLSSREGNGNLRDGGRQGLLSQTENSMGVILAACGATRSLSRSVNTLRTSLMDAGVAAPLFVLLKHYDVNVQVAATSVISNLVLEFSPMRERECLGELGPGWLKQIVCNDMCDSTSAFGVRSDRETSVGTPLAMGTPNAAGEQVDLLNATDGPREGGRAAIEEEEEDLRMADSVGALSRPDSDHQQRDQRLSSGRAARGQNETITTNQLRADNLAIQKEGLDFIRNLICGNDALEMIDYLFEELGQHKIFEMLISKLQPRLINAFNRERRSLESSVRQRQPQTDIVISVCYIVVHLAAGLPRHRQLLISQPELLTLMLPLFGHAHHEVRACCAWIVINLTWMDDQSDHPSCRERAQKLVNLRWYEQLQMLESDPELDVRERTKTALHQINCAIR